MDSDGAGDSGFNGKNGKNGTNGNISKGPIQNKHLVKGAFQFDPANFKFPSRVLEQRLVHWLKGKIRLSSHKCCGCKNAHSQFPLCQGGGNRCVHCEKQDPAPPNFENDVNMPDLSGEGVCCQVFCLNLLDLLMSFMFD